MILYPSDEIQEVILKLETIVSPPVSSLKYFEGVGMQVEAGISN